jgi:O-antigen/teichoic acid export membrane protein
MTFEDVKRNIWRNTISNYICVGLRLVTGVIMFRLLFKKLSLEEFGYWALLWSVFGYGILLDFGFGFTAQKRVAELSVHQDWIKLSQVLSTIFYSYVGVAAVIIVGGYLGADAIVSMFQITPENRGYFRDVLIFFLCGLGIAFPLGLFPEILRGQQRISLANNIFSAGMIANFILAAAALHFGWGLKALFTIALTCTLIPDLICGIFAMRQMPAVRIHPGFFSRKMVSETMSFSLFAYVTTLSTIIMTKTDQLVISSVLAVSAVALYQAGAKVAEMFAGISQQLPDTLSPAAAHLHAKGGVQALQSLLINGTRFSVMVATPLYLICAFYMELLLQLLTGEPAAARETYWVAQILLVWAYAMVVTQSVPKRIFMMCGHEKKLMFLGLGEALLNLGLSVALIFYYRNILCVAIGSLISTVVFGCFYLWPWAAREAKVSGWALARTVVLPTWLACLPLAALIVFQRILPQLDFRGSLWLLLMSSSAALLVAALGLWKLALTSGEREKLTLVFKKFLRREHAV